MYLNKILDKTRCFLRNELNSILYEATTSYQDKIYDNVLSVYDKTLKNVLENKEKLIVNSSYEESEILHELYLNKPFYSFLYKGRMISYEKQREFYFTYIKEELNLLILKGNSLLYDFENVDEKRKFEIEFDLKFSQIKNLLQQYLEKIIVFEFYHGKKKNDKSHELKEINIDFLKKDKVLNLLVKHKLINEDLRINKNSFFSKPINISRLIVKLYDLNLIKMNNQIITRKYFEDLFKTKIHSSNLNHVLGLFTKNDFTKNDRRVMEQLSFLDVLREETK
jgi:hypothetical protein